MNNLIIGIAGGSGSGKTTLACRLKALFGEDEVRLISHDSYYKRHDELPFEERCKLNYDHPDAFDNALLIYHLQELKAGRAIDCPVYDYADHNRSNEVQHIEPAPVLIVEGILPFVEPELCAMFDYKIFVDTDADERILRRLVRDVKERGRSLDSVIHQYLTTVKPMHEAFVEPSKRNAASSSPTAARTPPPSRCWPTTSAASSRKQICSELLYRKKPGSLTGPRFFCSCGQFLMEVRTSARLRRACAISYSRRSRSLRARSSSARFFAASARAWSICSAHSHVVATRRTSPSSTVSIPPMQAAQRRWPSASTMCASPMPSAVQ